MNHLLLFGGSFDPIHHGHLFIATATAERLGADRVLFVPTGRPHHRSPLAASIEHRLGMLHLALETMPHASIDTTELHAEATGYSVDTVGLLRTTYPTERLSFLVGEDSLTRSRWHRFDDFVAQLDHLVIAPRNELASPTEESPTPLSEVLHAMPQVTRERMTILDLPRVTISASEIRERQRRGETIRYLVPETVRSYIEQHGLYRATEPT